MATIIERNGKFFCQVRRKGFPSISKTFKTMEDAKEFASDLESSIEDDRMAKNEDLFDENSYRLPITNITLKSLYRSTVKRAKQSGLEHSISENDFFNLYELQDGSCAVSGLPFYAGKQESWRTQPFFPSLDRIDSTKGYVAGNVRFVCFAVNVALNDWGEDVLTILAFGISAKAINNHVINQYGNLHTAQKRLVSSGQAQGS
jgi:hypothetical protein